MEYQVNRPGEQSALKSDVPAGVAPASPRMSAEQEWKHRLYQQLMKRLDLTLLADLPEAEGRERIREAAQQMMAAEALPLNLAARQRIVKEIEDEILALGPLEPLLADPTVSDILVNGPESVYIERKGRLQLTEVRFYNDRHLLNIIDRIVTRVGRRIDESSPMVDARLKDGSRVNAVIPPLAIDGPMLSIRRFAVDRLTGEQLESFGTIDARTHLLLSSIVRGRLNVVISGGTGSGKTTLLNVMSGFIPADERIITVEDSAELQLQQPHVVRLETRPPSIEGTGEVTQRDLVRNSLRMRPDRIVIGEVRGEEALSLLQAMTSGHGGSMTTTHATYPDDTLRRLETMAMMADVEMPLRALRSQVASAVQLIVQTSRFNDGSRKITHIVEVLELAENGEYQIHPLFVFNHQGTDADGTVLGELEPTGKLPTFMDEAKARGVRIDEAWFQPD